MWFTCTFCAINQEINSKASILWKVFELYLFLLKKEKQWKWHSKIKWTSFHGETKHTFISSTTLRGQSFYTTWKLKTSLLSATTYGHHCRFNITEKYLCFSQFLFLLPRFTNFYRFLHSFEQVLYFYYLLHTVSTQRNMLG